MKNKQAINIPRIKPVLIVCLAVMLALVIGGKATAAVSAVAAGSVAPMPDDPPPTTPSIDGEPGAAGSGDSNPDPGSGGAGDGDGDGSGSANGSGTNVTNIQSNEYYFDTTSWLDALIHTLTKDSNKSVSKYQPALKEAARGSLGMLYAFGTDGIEGISQGKLLGPTRKIWQVAFGVALALFPLVMVINIFLTYSQGLGAGSARAEMVQNLVEGMVLLGFAWGSYILVNYVISIGWGLASFVMEVGVSGGGGKYSTLERLVNSVVDIAVGGFAGMIFFYFTIFFVIFTFMLLGALSLSYYAIIVVAVLCVAISPVVIVLGGVPQFKWVYGLWMKILSGVLLLPIFNALMIRLWATIASPGWGPLGVGNGLITVVTNLGLLSILITINGKVGQFTFGPALAAAKKAAQATIVVGKLLASAVALAAGAPAAAAAVAPRPNAGSGAGANPGVPAGDGGGGGSQGGGQNSPPAGQTSSPSVSGIASGANRAGKITPFDMLARPGKVARAAADGQITSEEMNRMAVSGKLVESMWRNDPAMRVLTTPMSHGIRSAVQEDRKLEARAWAVSREMGREAARMTPRPSNDQQQASRQLRNSILNYHNPGAPGLQEPENFADFLSSVQQTVTGMQRAHGGLSGGSFEGLPEGVHQTAFMSASGMLLQTGHALVPDMHSLTALGQTPITIEFASSLMKEVAAFNPGSEAARWAAATINTAQDIKNGAVSLEEKQAVLDQFGRHLNGKQ